MSAAEDHCLVTGHRPSGFRVIPGFVAAADQREIECWILSNFAWETRRQGSLPPSEEFPHDGPIPAWAEDLGRRMVGMHVFAHRPDHVLLRRYERGTGVVPHIDREAYGPVVAGLTLGSSRVFQLTRAWRHARLEALLLPGDLYVMTGDARYRWQHGIPFTHADEFRGATFPRTNGFSVTWRHAPGKMAPARWWARALGSRGPGR